MARKQTASKKRPDPVDSPLPSDLEDEVEKFHKKRDKLSLNMEDDEVTDDDSLPDEDDAVLDVSDGSESEEVDTDDEIERGTRFGQREIKSSHAYLFFCHFEFQMTYSLCFRLYSGTTGKGFRSEAAHCCRGRRVGRGRRRGR